MIPDARSARLVRAWAIGWFFVCCVLACAAQHEPPRTAQKIVSLGGPVTETVFALGAGDRVVAVDSSSVYPSAAAGLPQVGYQRTIAAEGVLSKSPDLVIASADAGPPSALEQIRAAGVRVAVMPAANTPEEAAVRIEQIGDAIGKSAEGKALAQKLRTDVAAVLAQQRPPSPRAIVVYARGAGTLLVAGFGTPATAMLALAGGTNVATSFHGYKPLSAEVLIEAAPDVIVIPARGLETIGGESGLLALPGISQTPAGKSKHIVALDDLLLLGFGPRTAEGISQLAAGLQRAAASDTAANGAATTDSANPATANDTATAAANRVGTTTANGTATTRPDGSTATANGAATAASTATANGAATAGSTSAAKPSGATTTRSGATTANGATTAAASSTSDTTASGAATLGSTSAAKPSGATTTTGSGATTANSATTANGATTAAASSTSGSTASGAAAIAGGRDPS